MRDLPKAALLPVGARIARNLAVSLSRKRAGTQKHGERCAPQLVRRAPPDE
jgi:hypothetical protein